jgi:hypothetical protein
MVDKYAEERKPPKVPSCPQSTIRFVFDGRYLKGLGGKSLMMYPAVSGKPEAGKFVYSRERQRMVGKGPIPEGDYWVQPSQIWDNAWYKHGSTAGWGNHRLTIHPYPKTQTYGRGGFFIHGGSIAGSAGCIDLTSHIDSFIKDLERELSGRPECFLSLRVTYASTRPWAE